MSVHDQAAAAILSQIALATDGAFLGIALGYIAVQTILKFAATSSAIRKIEGAPSLQVSDFRSVLCPSDSSDGEKLVVVRGTVEAKSAMDGNWKANVLVAHESGDKAIILKRTRMEVDP